MKWFKHESDAHANIKLQAIIDKGGVSAFGYYWACVELVASQGENYCIKREKRWEMYLKKILNIEVDEQKKYLLLLARQNLIDRDSLKKGDLYIPKLEERCDEYTLKSRRKSGHTPDNVLLEEKRREKNRIEEKNTAHVSYLKSIPEEDLEEFYKRFDCSKKTIISKAEDLLSWCETNGKVKKNYKTFLLVALKKDFQERKEPIKKVEFNGGHPVVYEEKRERTAVPDDIKKSVNNIINNMKVS